MCLGAVHKSYRSPEGKGGVRPLISKIAIMHEQSKWHEAQPSASDEANALLLLSNLGRKHILMARSEAEGPNFLKY